VLGKADGTHDAMEPGISGRAAIVGLGATEFSKNSGRTELRLAMEAVLAALADAGIAPEEVDGFSSYRSTRCPSTRSHACSAHAR
jgi:3-oxoacyl-[acyl-carrier-protein] synthase III